MPGSRTLQTAENRRDDVLSAALPIFARSGYFGANTTEVAHAAGISQAYLYRLFENKEALFVAVIGRVTSLIAERLGALRAEDPDADVATILERSSARPAEAEDAIAVLLHAAAAATVPAIGAAVRDCYRAQADRLSGLGANDEQIRGYFAWSQYRNVLRAAGIPAEPGDRRLVPPTG